MMVSPERLQQMIASLTENHGVLGSPSELLSSLRELQYLRMLAPPAKPRIFRLGERVHKLTGSAWHGFICGFYSSTITAEGYVIESEREVGSCQIYPAQALESVDG